MAKNNNFVSNKDKKYQEESKQSYVQPSKTRVGKITIIILAGAMVLLPIISLIYILCQ